MLPAFLTSPRQLATLGTAAALVTALSAPPAMAEWGDKQQNFLAGVVSTVAVAAILKPDLFFKAPPPAAQPVSQTPVYYTPAPTQTVSIYSTPAATAFNAYQPNQRKNIQSKLASMGYYRSTIDGDFGPNTYNAVVSYANASGNSSLLSNQAGAFTIYDGLIY
jgi:hypothetical protein